MTCIVGLIKPNGNILMGADSAGVAGTSLSTRLDEKVFVNGPMIMGFTSSFRMGQLLRYQLIIPPIPENGNQDAYMVTNFINAVRTCFKIGGYMKIKEGVETGGTFLVGFKGQLYIIDSDFQVGKNEEDYNAVGSGEDLALGSLHTTEKYNISSEERIKLALEAAAYHNSGVSEPFNIMELQV